jgi:hypothetical protein
VTSRITTSIALRCWLECGYVRVAADVVEDQIGSEPQTRGPRSPRGLGTEDVGEYGGAAQDARVAAGHLRVRRQAAAIEPRVGALEHRREDGMASGGRVAIGPGPLPPIRARLRLTAGHDERQHQQPRPARTLTPHGGGA